MSYERKPRKWYCQYAVNRLPISAADPAVNAIIGDEITPHTQYGPYKILCLSCQMQNFIKPAQKHDKTVITYKQIMVKKLAWIRQTAYKMKPLGSILQSTFHLQWNMVWNKWDTMKRSVHTLKRFMRKVKHPKLQNERQKQKEVEFLP